MPSAQNSTLLTDGIPVAKITREEDSMVKIAATVTNQTDPLASFDITSPESHLNGGPSISNTNADTISTPLPSITKLDPVDVKNVPSIPVVEDISLISRPVIRSRIVDINDPQQAEREGALIRSQHSKGDKRNVKRAHREEEL